MMDQVEFEHLLDIIADRLTHDVRASNTFHKPNLFEDRVRQVVFNIFNDAGHLGVMDAITQGFPDIVVDQFGIEVKATESDSWRCIANSVSEGKRVLDVETIYVIYGKMGGVPQVKWAHYGEPIIHVRTSHVPHCAAHCQ